MRKLYLAVSFALALAAGAPALAASQGSGAAPHATEMTAKDFIAYHDRLEKNLDSKQYDYVNAANRAKIARDQDAIRDTLAGKQSLDELDEASRRKVIAAHEDVLAVMDDAELDKVTCKREHKMGSRMGKQVCTSARERQQAAESARDAVSRARTCSGTNCGSNT